MNKEINIDVAIVGAGCAGLYALIDWTLRIKCFKNPI